ncbi:MAG: hypothetical protein KH828_00130 [Clostridiales bacterium]|nr:hypothetical protein [Clostridiales bacterium]
MKKKGSVTMFFSLFMAVFLVLVQVIFRSVQIAGGRVQAEGGVEEGLYSVFAGYDRELFERYHVFFLDGGYGTGKLQPGRMYQEIEESLMSSLFPGKRSTGIRGENLWRCSKESGAITGYTLATDQQGKAFKIQAVDYMKETAGLQGIQLLLERDKVQGEIVEQQEREGTLNQAKEAQKTYERAKKEAEQKEESQGDSETEGIPSVEVPKDFVNPLEVIKQLKTRGILALVLPNDTEISTGSIEGEAAAEKGTYQTGMGTLWYGEDPDTTGGNLIFREYMMKHLDCYGKQRKGDGESADRIMYQLEYTIAGKETDIENLKAVVNRLLAVREAANMVYLMKDPLSQARIHEMALLICSAIGLPFLEGAVSLALQAAWAFGESILDLRQLLQGGNVPLIKTAAEWKLALENLSSFPQLFGQTQEKQEKGLSYTDYLRILLSLGKSEKQVLRTMDMVQQIMKTEEQNPNFQMDLCVSYLQVEMGVSCGGKNFSIQRDYGYEM